MEKIFVILCLLGIGTARAEETCANKPILPDPVFKTVQDITEATVNTCLEQGRRDDFEAKKRAQEKGDKNKSPPYTFHELFPDQLPQSCAEGDLQGLIQALERQIENCQGIPERPLAPGGHSLHDTVRFGCQEFTRAEWCLETNRKMLELAKAAKDFPAFVSAIKNEFSWYQSDGRLEDAKDGTFKKGDYQITSYDTPPPIEASSVPTPEFSYPVYKAPPNLVHLNKDDSRSCGADPATGVKTMICLQQADGSYAPVPNRKEIDQGKALAGQGLELAYVKDPVDMAFLMLQGSGSLNIHYPDGSTKKMRLNYHDQNGRPRNMLGRVLKCEGAAPAQYGSEKAIRAYLAADPAKRDMTLDFDQSYVFFELSDKGPFGADGIAITPRYSFATDRSVIPTGTVMLFHTKRPGGPNPQGGCTDLTSLGVSQDSGGAINGAHADWYMGDGAEANTLANDVNNVSTMVVAMPKGAGRNVDGCGAPGVPPAAAAAR
jgi:membrane-bound lytic murein transglycosylase